MTGVIDGSLVGLALLASGGYVLLSLGPRGLRRRLAWALSRAAARAPAFLGLRRMAQRFAASAGKAQGACGGCDDCASGQAAAKTPAEGEVRVPVVKIGRRG
jgi:hypothetical protein